MIGATARAEQFYGRIGSESTKGSRKGFGLLGGGENPAAILSDEQRIESKRSALMARLEKNGDERSSLRRLMGEAREKHTAEFRAMKHRRDILLKEHAEIVEEQRALNFDVRAGAPKPLAPDVDAQFIEVAREVLTEAQFKIILKEARSRAAATTRSQQ